MSTQKKPIWPPIPEGDLPDTRLGDPKDPKSWHAGCMVTQSRAIRAASILFPEDVAHGSDCRAEIGREGLPCRTSATRNAQWAKRVAEVRRAMIKAFDD